MRLKFIKDSTGQIFEFNDKIENKFNKKNREESNAEILVEEMLGNYSFSQIKRENREQFLLKNSLGIC
jgi:hypothetical protein